MPVVDQAKLDIIVAADRQTVDAVNIALGKFQAEARKSDTAIKSFATSQDIASAAGKSLVTTQDRLNKSMGNISTSLSKSQLAFAGLGGELGKVSNQIFDVTDKIENFEFIAKKNGQSINLFTSSLGDATNSLGKLSVASLVVSSAIGGWKIGTWINETTGLGKALDNLTQSQYAWMTPLTGTARKLEELNGVTKQQEQTLGTLNDRLREQLWDKYGIAVNTANMSLIQANDALLRAANAVNSVTAAQANGLKTISAAADAAQIKIQQAFMTTEQLLQQNLATQADLQKKMEKSISHKWVDMYAGQIAALKGEAANLEIALIKEAEAAKKSTAAHVQAAPKVKQLKDEFDLAAKSVGQMGISLDDLAPRLDNFITQISATQTVVNMVSGTMLHLVHNLDLLAPAIDDASSSALTFDQALDGMVKAQGQLQKSAKESVFSFDNIVSALDRLSSAFANSESGVLRFIGTLAGGVSSGMKAYESILTSTGSKTAAWAGGIGTAASYVGDAIGGEVGSAISTIGQFTATGAMFGPWGAAIGAGIGAAIVIFKSFGTNWGEETDKIIKDMYGLMNVSEELTKKITDLAKELKDAGLATILSIPELIKDVGVAESNFNSFYLMIHDVFSYLERGQIDAATATGILEQSLGTMFEASKDGFGLINAQMQDLISLTKTFGLEVKVVAEIMKGQLSSGAAGLNAIIGAGIDSVADFERVSRMFSETFNSMIENGFSFNEAMQALQPTYDAILQAMKDLGLEGTAAFKSIQSEMRFLRKNEDIINGLAGVNAMLQMLHNTGKLNIHNFKDLERTAKDMFRKMNEDGKISNKELRAAAPTLLLLEELATRYGYELGASTQNLLDLARQKGFIDKAKEAKTLEQNIGELVVEIRALVAEIKGIAPAFSSATSAARSFGQAVGGIPAPGIGGGSGGGGGAAGAQRFSSQSFSGGSTSGTTNVSSRYTFGGTITATVPIEVTTVNNTIVDGDTIARKVVRKLETRQVPLDIRRLRVSLSGKR